METLDKIIAYIGDKAEVTWEDCASHLGVALTKANRAMIGASLRLIGWRKYRARRDGELCYVFKPAPIIDPALSVREKELRKFLRARDKVTAEECCYALRITPGPEIKDEVVAHLKRWRWVRVTPIVRGRIEWHSRQGPSFSLVPAAADS